LRFFRTAHYTRIATVALRLKVESIYRYLRRLLAKRLHGKEE
jgi:hypothetical protein